MKTKFQKQVEARARQEARENRSDREQLKMLKDRPGRSIKEKTKLIKRIAYNDK